MINVLLFYLYQIFSAIQIISRFLRQNYLEQLIKPNQGILTKKHYHLFIYGQANQHLNSIQVLNITYKIQKAKMSQILESNHEESFNNLQLNRETCEKIESSLESQNVGETLKSNSQCQKVNSKQVSTEKSQTEIKETKKRVRNKRINQNIRKGHWSEEQNKKYHWFLEIYSQHFIQKQMRRLDKIFKTMSRFIGTREAQQCRSHHQKMQKKYISFPNILTHLRISHYGTEQTNPILQDMNRNNIKQKSILLQMKELQEIEDRKAIPSTPKTVQGMNLVNEMQLQREIPIFRENNFNSFENILGNDYEKQLDFIDELLF